MQASFFFMCLPFSSFALSYKLQAQIAYLYLYKYLNLDDTVLNLQCMEKDKFLHHTF